MHKRIVIKKKLKKINSNLTEKILLGTNEDSHKSKDSNTVNQMLNQLKEKFQQEYEQQ